MAWLRVWARGLLGTEAAVELLIGHRAWLCRRDFVAVAVAFGRDTFTGAGVAAVDWLAVVEALEAGELPCSSSEGQVLRIAASLAADVPVMLGQVVSGLDERDVVAVTAAVLHAAGLGGRGVLIGCAHQCGGAR